MSQIFRSNLILAVLIVCLVAVPVGAVIQETTVKGTVDTVNQPKNTLTIANPQQYGCVYPAVGNGPVCTWSPIVESRITTSRITSSIPDAAALTLFKPGDTVIGTATGGAYDSWITLAKLYGSRPNEEYVTDIIGDVRTIPTPLVGNYALDLKTAPDCALCSGDSCTAGSSDTIVTINGRVVAEQVLTPGQTLAFNGKNDGSSISVTFVKGHALSNTCPQGQNGMVGGLQPISVYLVSVVPPTGYGQVNIRTATTTRPEEALTTPTPLPTVTVATPAAPASTPTAKSGSLPLAAIVSLGFVVAIIAMMKK